MLYLHVKDYAKDKSNEFYVIYFPVICSPQTMLSQQLPMKETRNELSTREVWKNIVQSMHTVCAQ